METADYIFSIFLYLMIGGFVFVILYEEDLPPISKYIFMLNLTRYLFWPVFFTIEIAKSFYRYWVDLEDE